MIIPPLIHSKIILDSLRKERQFLDVYFVFLHRIISGNEANQKADEMADDYDERHLGMQGDDAGNDGGNGKDTVDQFQPGHEIVTLQDRDIVGKSSDMKTRVGLVEKSVICRHDLSEHILPQITTADTDKLCPNGLYQEQQNAMNHEKNQEYQKCIDKQLILAVGCMVQHGSRDDCGADIDNRRSDYSGHIDQQQRPFLKQISD